jgi:kinesin family protein 3/17
LKGYNSTIIAYGQTGTGKTYTMHGFTFNASSPDRGIIPRSLHSIFSHIESLSNQTTFMVYDVKIQLSAQVRASYLQIYNEQISDLLRPDHQ